MVLASVEKQMYSRWELCVATSRAAHQDLTAFVYDNVSQDRRVRFVTFSEGGHVAGATNAGLSLAEGEFVAFLNQEDELVPTALLEVAELLQQYPDADIIYSDHDLVGEDGLLRDPHFKPAWSPELLLGYMYFGDLKVYRTDLLRRVGGMRPGFEGSADYDLALRLVELTDRVRHIPKVLYHRRASASFRVSTGDDSHDSFEAGRRAVDEALERRGIQGSAIHPEFAERARVGMFKIRFHSTENIPITIIIPTRNKCALLRTCVESIERLTRHQAYEILIIDNGSTDPETLDYLQLTPHQVLPCVTQKGFNFSAIMNFAVHQSRSDFFVLLNNDTEVIAPEWLDEMIGYGRIEGVGAVGAKLLYADQRIQHAGVILGVHGLTGHAWQPLQNAQVPLEYGLVARNYVAVTGACLLSRKPVFEGVGGFNESDLGVAWNDVDYCLRLCERGYRVVMNPHALLYHLESQSRGDEKHPSEVVYMKTHWQQYIDDDPFFNINFSRADSEFKLKTDPNEAQHFFYR